MATTAVTETAQTESFAPAPASLDELFVTVDDKVQEMTKHIRELQTQMKNLRKLVSKSCSKKSKDKPTKTEVPRTVVPKLATFMGLTTPVTTKTEAIRAVSKYINENGLKDKKNFKVNKELHDLLGLELDSSHPFIIIGGKITHLFVKTEA